MCVVCYVLSVDHLVDCLLRPVWAVCWASTGQSCTALFGAAQAAGWCSFELPAARAASAQAAGWYSTGRWLVQPSSCQQHVDVWEMPRGPPQRISCSCTAGFLVDSLPSSTSRHGLRPSVLDYQDVATSLWAAGPHYLLIKWAVQNEHVKGACHSGHGYEAHICADLCQGLSAACNSCMLKSCGLFMPSHSVRMWCQSV
jgi:hypothetical protein